MTAEAAKNIIRDICDNNDRNWVELDGVDFIYDGANRFRVRDVNNADVYAFGSTTVVQCLMAGNVGPAVTQQLTLSMAEHVRNRRSHQ